MIPLAGTCRYLFAFTAEFQKIAGALPELPMRPAKMPEAESASPFHHANQTRKAGLPAPRVACLLVFYIKPILGPRKWQASALCPNAASVPSSRTVPAMASLCLKRPHVASAALTFKCSASEAPEDGGRGNRARTCDLRFWRPPLYQLSYTPSAALSFHKLRRNSRTLLPESESCASGEGAPSIQGAAAAVDVLAPGRRLVRPARPPPSPIAASARRWSPSPDRHASSAVPAACPARYKP